METDVSSDDVLIESIQPSFAGFSFNPFDSRFHANPKAVYRYLRDHEPVHYNEDLNLYVLSRYEDVTSALENEDIFSFCHGEMSDVFDPSLFADLMGSFRQDDIEQNNPHHTRRRPAPQLSSATTARVERFTSYYLDCALDEVRRSGCGVEFIDRIAGPISMAIIADLIGFPPQWRDSIRCWIDLAVGRDEGNPVMQVEALRASERLLKFLHEFWDERKEQSGNGDTVADRIIECVERGALSRRQGISFLWGLCFAGQEATTRLLGNAVYQAWTNQLDYLLHRSPGVLDEFLTEVMRVDSPAQIVYRSLLADHERHGIVMRKGARVALLLGSANVDERAFGVDAARLRVGRRSQRNPLTFGWGPYCCPGSALGEMEVRVCLQQFFARVRCYRIDEPNCKRVHTSTIHGFARLPLFDLELA